MKVEIRDKDALVAVSPAALSAYARALGWRRDEPWQDVADVYVGDGLPEILVPITSAIGDFASAVATLIDTFSEVTGQDQLSVFRNLITADRDIIRVRAVDSDNDGSLTVSAGADLVCGARNLILAAACSLHDPQPLYRTGSHKIADEYLRGVRLGQTEHGSFAITLLSPVVSPPIQMSLSQTDEFGLENQPFERRITYRFVEALAAVRQATDDTNRGFKDAFQHAVGKGVSANLCESLATLIKALSRVEISVSWASTWLTDKPQSVERFSEHDEPILRQASQAYRSRLPIPDETLIGYVPRLNREQHETSGTVTFHVKVDGVNRSVSALLPYDLYRQAIRAHDEKATVVLRGDLERAGERWHLLNPSIEDVIVFKDT